MMTAHSITLSSFLFPHFLHISLLGQRAEQNKSKTSTSSFQELDYFRKEREETFLIFPISSNYYLSVLFLWCCFFFPNLLRYLGKKEYKIFLARFWFSMHFIQSNFPKILSVSLNTTVIWPPDP